jgi:hypothetical protein
MKNPKINKEDYHKEQNFCKDCNQPINQRTERDLLEGKCNRCYKMTYKENILRKKNKKRTKERKRQREYKNNI